MSGPQHGGVAQHRLPVRVLHPAVVVRAAAAELVDGDGAAGSNGGLHGLNIAPNGASAKGGRPP